jgi:hypothetical protein
MRPRGVMDNMSVFGTENRGSNPLEGTGFAVRIKNVKIKLMRRFFLIILFLILAGSQVQAAGLVPCGGEGEPVCTFCHFFVMINAIVKFVMFTLVPAIAVLMLVIGGVMFFFAGGSPNILSRAKGVITSVVIGLVIIFAAWVIVNTILTGSGIVQAPSILQWYQIDCPAP